MANLVRVYKSNERNLDEVIYIAEFIRDLPANMLGYVEVKVVKIVDPFFDSQFEVGSKVHIEELRIDFIGVEPDKP